MKQFALRWSMRLLALFGLATLLIITTPVVFWLLPRAAPSDLPAGDTLIVLGAGTAGDLPDLDTYWRCVYAANYFRRGSIARMIVVGGHAAQGVEPVASVMSRFLRQAGIPPEKILVETQSRSTRENALLVKPLLDPAFRPILLTSDYHVPRAAAAFRRAGMDLPVVAVPYTTTQGRLRGLRLLVVDTLIREKVKHIYYWTKGWA